MAYRRGRRNNGSILDDALRRGWQFSAVLSAGTLLLVYVGLPMMGKNKMMQPVIASFQQIGLIMALVFAVIATFKFLQAKRRIDAEAKAQYETAMERVRGEPKLSLKPQAWSLEVLQSIEWKRFEELVGLHELSTLQGQDRYQRCRG